MRRPAIVTITTRNYAAQARALVASAARHAPGVPVYVCLPDLAPGERDEEIERDGATVLRGADLGVPGWRRFAFQYSAFELCCALKPWLVEHVLGRDGITDAIYLDGDTSLVSGLEPVLEALAAVDVLLTPHHVRPLTPARYRDADRNRFGAFNAGFIAFRGTPNGLAACRYWQSLLAKLCVRDAEAGWLGDQHWLDWLPCMFEGVGICRHPGLNAAVWNLPERAPTLDERGRVLVGGAPLILYHFAGFRPETPDRISIYPPEQSLDALPALRGLLLSYAEEVMRLGFRERKALGYGFARLSDGTPIDRTWREAVRVDHPATVGVDDPFDAACRTGWKAALKRAGAEAALGRKSWRLKDLEKRAALLEVLLGGPVFRAIWRVVRRFARFRA